jgi:hypothetical protein
LLKIIYPFCKHLRMGDIPKKMLERILRIKTL